MSDLAETLFLERIRAQIPDPNVIQKRMFGGVCFMLNGNMLVCASKRGLMVRVGKDGNTAALGRPHAAPMEMTGRPMAGYVIVAAEGVAEDSDLKSWVDTALAYVRSLPEKPVKPDRPRKSKTSG